MFRTQRGFRAPLYLRTFTSSRADSTTVRLANWLSTPAATGTGPARPARRPPPQAGDWKTRRERHEGPATDACTAYDYLQLAVDCHKRRGEYSSLSHPPGGGKVRPGGGKVSGASHFCGDIRHGKARACAQARGDRLTRTATRTDNEERVSKSFTDLVAVLGCIGVITSRVYWGHISIIYNCSISMRIGLAMRDGRNTWTTLSYYFSIIEMTPLH